MEDLLCARHLDVTYSFNNIYSVPAGCRALPWGLRNGRLDFGPQGILSLVGVASVYPSSCNSESSFDGGRTGRWHQGRLPGGGS